MLKAVRLTRTPLEEVASQQELSNLEWANVRLLGEVRLALIITAMLLFFQPPAEPGIALFLVAGAYAAFSASLLKKAVRRTVDVHFRIVPWVDAAVYGSIVALTGLLESRFAVFLLFPAVALSFERGMRPGMGLAIICMLWLVGITLI
ncbi:MAG TPA: hypothetical protein VLN59_05640, partial [Burkholderiales bacterium]|nr:hypothetical protein [Burkholderiales bacterium]